MNPYFNLKNSSTVTEINCKDKVLGSYSCRCGRDNEQCTFTVNYAEGSTLEGYFVEDVVQIPAELFEVHQTNHTNDSVRFAFGCTTKETELFGTQKADGILGLGLHTNSKPYISFSLKYVN